MYKEMSLYSESRHYDDVDDRDYDRHYDETYDHDNDNDDDHDHDDLEK